MFEILVITGGLLGGLGLFLLAVSMISTGLRAAAGRQLRGILERWTGSPLRGIGAGTLITAIVQSSSAVTVATIGFVNAGVLSLRQALGVIYGANVGTTMTGWLVAAVGFNIKLEAFALPLVGIGMFLRLTGPGDRRGAFGEALAGFGLFFIGIDILRDAFSGLAGSVNLPQVADNPLQLLVLVGVGFLMTVLTQSSSAAVAMILTAASGEALNVNGAAAMVIGANIGTTSTAALAVIGATSNAKRVAAAHILFNVVTGVVALLILPAIPVIIDLTANVLGLETAPAVQLALFHTVFNLLGVALMLPLAGPLATFLERRFRTAEEIEGRPRYLDHTVLESPSLAGSALALELARLAAITRRMSAAALSTELSAGKPMRDDLATVHALSRALSEFVTQLSRKTLTGEVAEQMPKVLRASRYLVTVAELAATIADLQPALTPLTEPALADQWLSYRHKASTLLMNADIEREGFSPEDCREALADAETQYQALKAALLNAGARYHLSIPAMNDYLEQSSRTRRMLQQTIKGIILLADLPRGAGAANEEETGEAEQPPPLRESD